MEYLTQTNVLLGLVGIAAAGGILYALRARGQRH